MKNHIYSASKSQVFGKQSINRHNLYIKRLNFGNGLNSTIITVNATTCICVSESFIWVIKWQLDLQKDFKRFIQHM